MSAEKLTAKQRRQRAVERLMAAMDRCAVARGEAQWTNGYRAARPEKEAELHAKEMRQWDAYGLAERAFLRLAQRILRGGAK